MATYEVWLCNDRGERLTLLDPFEFEYSRVVGGYGYVSVTLPYDDILFNLAKVDFQIHIYRAPDGGKLSLYNAYFLRNKSATDFSNHVTEMRFSGPDLREILARRIVAYAADEAEALKADNADDMMKAMVRENLGSSAASARDYSNNGFSVAPDTTSGPSITKAFAWKNVLTSLQQIHQTSVTAGTPTFFDIEIAIPNPFLGTPTLRFQTYTDYPGRDLRTLSTGGFGFSKEFGNLSFVHYEEDYYGEANYIYAGGQGTGALRDVQEASDSDRIGASIWNRRELFANASGASTSAGVTGAANERLNEKRPKKMLRADLLDTDDTKFQRDWDCGDYVTVKAFGRQFDEIIRVVSVKVARNGSEDISARFEAGTLMGDVVERIYTETKELAARVEALEAEDK